MKDSSRDIRYSEQKKKKTATTNVGGPKNANKDPRKGAPNCPGTLQ